MIVINHIILGIYASFFIKLHSMGTNEKTKITRIINNPVFKGAMPGWLLFLLYHVLSMYKAPDSQISYPKLLFLMK